MVVCQDAGGRAVLVIRRTNIRTTAIFTEHGHRRLRVIFNSSFDRDYKELDTLPKTLAQVWLKSTIKLTDRVRKELKMAEHQETQETLAEAEVLEPKATKSKKAKKEKVAKEPKEKKVKEPKERKGTKVAKGEGKFPYIDPASTFKALENTRNRSGSRRSGVYVGLVEYGPCTGEFLAEALGLAKKDVLLDLRCLVADGKAEAEVPVKTEAE